MSAALALPQLRTWFAHKTRPLEGIATVPVRRADMNVTLTTGGRIDSAEKTVVECELQRLEVSVKGQAMGGGGSSTIIRVIDDGTMVKKGDLLCELDASEYKELLRQQRMTVKRARADHRQAELDLEVARVAVIEFREGIYKETLQQLSGQIALGKASWERARDRLGWVQNMLAKGYVPISQLRSEEINERRASFQLKQSEVDLDVFRRYSAPRTLRELEGYVLGAESTLNYQDRRLKVHIEREEMLVQQVENCTIRAPHDGMIIYAIDDERPIPIVEGMVVRQKQDLFHLPNLTKMVAKALVHETVAARVKPGMRTRLRVEGMPGHLLEGHVAAVAQLPTRNSWSEISYFYTEVAIDTIPRGLRPGMTAELEIATDRRRDVLAIPIEALGVEDGRDFCYVAHDDRVERRQIEIGQSTRGLLEVTGGLSEGESVVLDPSQFDEHLETLSPFDGNFSAMAARAEAQAEASAPVEVGSP
jgi:HlyD family secretion protein